MYFIPPTTSEFKIILTSSFILKKENYNGTLSRPMDVVAVF